MYRNVLQAIRKCIDDENYILTNHAREQMFEDHLDRHDLEKAIRNGRIVERQLDEMTNEYKYVLRGKSVSLVEIELVCKLAKGLIIITVYKL
jgi:hypothetical protein